MPDAAFADAKLRPDVLTVYAGGKATNFARVLGQLAAIGQADVGVHLCVVHPFRENEDDRFEPASEYYDALARHLAHVRLTSLRLPVDTLERKQRSAVHILDAASGEDLLNFTPRLAWSDAEVERFVALAQAVIRETEPDELVLAGSPPTGAEAVYEGLLSGLGPSPHVYLDTSGRALAKCISSTVRRPDSVVINRAEYESVSESVWRNYSGVIAVHDRSGCIAWEGSGDRLAHTADPSEIAQLDVEEVNKALGLRHGPSLGAGDAFHAGFVSAPPDAPLLTRAQAGMVAAGLTLRSDVGVSGFLGEGFEQAFRAIAGPQG